MPATTPVAKALRVTKRRAETRARLITAAFHVFSDKGYGHVTIEDVCEAAGYTRGAFYSQFESLEELFFLLYDQWAARNAEQVMTAMEGSDPLVDLGGAVERIVDTLLLDATGCSSSSTSCCMPRAIPNLRTGGKCAAHSCAKSLRNA
jgi:AcrR family transcriptional regulator